MISCDSIFMMFNVLTFVQEFLWLYTRINAVVIAQKNVENLNTTFNFEKFI
jgi:hypothetical protein